MGKSKKSEETAIVITSEGLRVLLEVLLERSENSFVVEKDEESEVNELIYDYLQYQKEVTLRENSENIPTEYKAVADILKSAGRAVQLNEVVKLLKECYDIHWNSKSAASKMISVMKRFPQVRKASFGYYEYVPTESEKKKQATIFDEF